MKIARIEPGKTTVSGRQVGFGLAPRINSAGRFNVAHKSLDLMLSNDAAASERLAAELEDHNKQRQATTMRMFGEAMSLVQREADVTRDCALVVAGTDWPRGMVGLVASRLVEKYARPAIVLGIENGLAHGSGRSIEQFDMSRLLDDTRSLLIGGGGHAGACGVHLEEGQIQPFRAAVLEHTARELDIGQLRPKVEADCEIDERDLDERLVHDLKKLEPCGKAMKSRYSPCWVCASSMARAWEPRASI
jgi:single-stranded-DNA-specific exonuclease